MYSTKGCFSFSFLFAVFASMISLTSSEILKFILRSTSSRKSNISTEAIKNVLTGLTKLEETNIQILYGSEYEDAAQYTERFLSKIFIGQMRLQNDGRFETLQKLLLPSSRPVLLVVLERPVIVIRIFKEIRKRMLNSHLVRWLVLMEEKSGESSILEIGEIINEGTHVIICKMNPDGNCNLFFPFVDNKGITRFTMKKKQMNAKNRLKYYSLSGRQMKVATREAMLSIRLGGTLPDGSVEIDSGSDFKLLKTLRNKLNFTYRAFTPEDNKWGNLQSDGSVTGIIGMVARREVTFGFSGLVLSESRESVTDFAWFTVGMSTIILSRSPREKTKTLAVLSPFRLKVWAAISLAVLFMGPVVYLFSYLLKTHDSHEAEDINTNLTWYQFNVFRGVINQGVFIKKSSTPHRLTIIFWLIFSVICTATYSGMLTSMFALPAYETPIDFLGDLPGAVYEGFTIGTLSDSSYEQFFKTSPDGIFQQTWNLFNHEDRSKSFVGNAMEGARRILSEKYIFITSDVFSRYLQRVFGAENFHLSREKFNPLTIGFACQTGSPVRDTLFYVALRLQEAGIMFKWLDDEFRKIPQSQSTGDKIKRSSALNFTHLQAAFYLLFFGMIMALITLFTEIMMTNKWKATER